MINSDENINDKQLDILLLICRFRFLHALHIQKFLEHKSGSRISLWLKDLTGKGFIKRRYLKKVGDINKPAVYYISLKGARYLKNKNKYSDLIVKRAYQEEKRSKSREFRNRLLFISDLYFYF